MDVAPPLLPWPTLPNNEMTFFTSRLPHCGQLKLLCRLGDKTSFSNECPQLGQVYSKIGMVILPYESCCET